MCPARVGTSRLAQPSHLKEGGKEEREKGCPGSQRGRALPSPTPTPTRPAQRLSTHPLAVFQWGRRTTCHRRGSTRTATTSSLTSGPWAACCMRWARPCFAGPGAAWCPPVASTPSGSHPPPRLVRHLPDQREEVVGRVASGRPGAVPPPSCSGLGRETD